MVSIDIEKFGPLVLDAVGRIGIPGIIAGAILYGGWKIGATLAQAHLAFLNSTQAVLEKQAGEGQKTTKIMGDIARGQQESNTNQAILIRNQEMILRHFIEQERERTLDQRNKP